MNNEIKEKLNNIGIEVANIISTYEKQIKSLEKQVNDLTDELKQIKGE